MKTVYLVRHGMTAGNKEKRYIGRTDEPLSEEGKLQAAALKAVGLPAFEHVFTSPYIRCKQTASILFPETAFTIVQGLRECDFGIFEGRTAAELENSAEYGSWLETGCTGPIPGGERVEDFKIRCRNAFLESMEEVDENGFAAFVAHGGCIMAVLEAYAVPKRAFYDCHIKNCGFVRCAFANGALAIEGGSLCS
ncbi:MAG TPA: histidine phosphatase family protein [Feifaniaceae bacterium]|nr:histidine phosphatase family protein [Feifaniaceae bacterium]